MAEWNELTSEMPHPELTGLLWHPYTTLVIVIALTFVCAGALLWLVQKW